MNGFHFNFNANKYFYFDSVNLWHTSLGYPMYDLNLVSRATGEIITIPLTSQYFDMLLEDMATQVVDKACQYLSIGMEEWIRELKRNKTE